jgi:hypothetical protein
LAPDSVLGKVLHTGTADYAWFDSAGRGTPALVQDVTRLVLALVFVLCAVMVHRAWQLKKQGKR